MHAEEGQSNNSVLDQTLDKIVKLELLEKENQETITKIWTEYHADKDCITAVIPKETYDTIFKRSQQYPIVSFWDCITLSRG